MTDEPSTPGGLLFEGVERAFGAQLALTDFDLRCAPGQVTALLGPNGAGKSTALSLAAGLLACDRGRILLGDRPISARRPEARSAFLPQKSAFAPMLTGREVLELVFTARGTDPQERAAVLEVTGVLAVADRPIRELSGGWVRRIDLACALAGPTELILLDEPFVGLDPETLDRLEVHLRARAEAGAAVLLASHAFEVVDRLGAAVAVLDEGRIRSTTAPGGLPSTALLRRALRGAPPVAQQGADGG